MPEKIDLCVIGLPKTGTTWLANVLSFTDEICVLDEADTLSQIWKKTTGKRKKSILFAESVTDPNFLGSYSERCSAIAALSKRLNFKKTVVTLRKPELWTYSLYRQYIKVGGVDSFKEHCSELKPYLDYRSLFKELDKLELKTYISNFEDLKQAPVKYLKALMNIIFTEKETVKIVENIPDENLHKKYNVGYKGASIRGLRWVNSLKKMDKKGVLAGISNSVRYSTKDLMDSKLVQLFNNTGKSLFSDEDKQFLKKLINNKHWETIEEVFSHNDEIFIPFDAFTNQLK